MSITVRLAVRSAAVFFRFFVVVLSLHLVLYTTAPSELVLGLTRQTGRAQPGTVVAVVAVLALVVYGALWLLAGPRLLALNLSPVANLAVMAVLALLLRQLLRQESAGSRDLGRLALVAGAALAFVTVAIPLQLNEQWITIGWALEGAALAWLYRRIAHRGLLLTSAGLLGAAFVRLALNPEIFHYAPRSEVPVSVVSS